MSRLSPYYAGMRKIVAILVLALLATAAAFSQTPGFTGDVNEITKRILSSTRYRLTPGDTYVVVVTMGGAVTSYSLVLQENYDLDVPYVGTVNVKGIFFKDLRKLLTDRIKRLLPMAEFITVGLQSPARFDVSVFGAVENPGIVTVSPLSRVSDAIALARGAKKGAGARQIQLIRGDQKLPVDLFRYSLNDGSDSNPTLEPGDTIVVPPQALYVTIAGMVRYPGPFEVVPGETLDTVLAYAGGILPEAQPQAVEIMRFNPDGTMGRISVNTGEEKAAEIRNGDRIRVPGMTESKETILMVGGFYGAPFVADKPTQIPPVPITLTVPYLPGMTLTRAFESVGGPTPYARLRETVVVRARTGQRIMVDAESLLRSHDPQKDIALEPGDTVSVPMVNQVFVVGEVRTPGKVPYLPGATVADYLLAAGGINPTTGDLNGVYFVDMTGNRKRASTGDPVSPGALIYADKNFVYANQDLFNNITIYTAFFTALLTFASTVISFINTVR
jgi:polysaccharide biosynthesis/export protein